MTHLQGLATEARSWFERHKRTPEDVIWVLKDEAPEWVTALVYAAHGDMLPDDWRYAFIVEALDALAEEEDPDRARDTLEADIYAHDLLRWLASHGHRQGYVDEAVEEYDLPRMQLTDTIGWGQAAEKWEVFDIVRQQLEDLIDQTADDTEDDQEEQP